MRSSRRIGCLIICFLLVQMLAVDAIAEEALKIAPIELDARLEEVESARIEAIQRAMPSTVSIFIPGGGGGGSGVLISSDGFALTNFHVSSPAGSYMRCGLSDGRLYDAVIVGIDPVGDLALIQLLGRDDFPFAEMADSRKARVGDWCMVIGNPFLLNTNLRPTVSWGILSGVGRYQYPSGTLLEYADCLQTDASINPGNSGGPLYNSDGRLLGIVGRASFEKRGRVNVGVGYAISINQAIHFLGDLRSGRIVDHATLGATVATDPEGGARISNMLDTSDAYRRGLRYGDVILEIDGRIVQSANQVQNVLATLPAGWRVKIVYRNEKEQLTTLVRLAGVHTEDELLVKMAAALPPPPPTPGPQEKKKKDDGENQDSEPEPKDNSEVPDEHGEDPHGDKAKVAEPTEIPEAVKSRFIARRGYANYHFNVLKQRSFIESLRQQFPAVGNVLKEQVWTIKGTTIEETPKPITIKVARDDFVLSIGQKTIEAKTKAELYEGISAGNESGILAGLDSWRRVLYNDLETFGECYYRGSVPFLGERPLRDCVVGVSGELETTWLSHPETKILEAVEVVADRDEDPAELLIRWGSGTQVAPTELELRYGTKAALLMKVEGWSIEDQPEAAQ